MCSIESMRNGNRHDLRSQIHSWHVQSNLWGMETPDLPLGRRKRRSSSIESMRNGNNDALLRRAIRYRVQSNLWGMETAPSKLVMSPEYPVQSNLWGMETTQMPTLSYHHGKVQSNLWGMETHPSGRQYPIFSMFNRIYEEWKQGVKRYKVVALDWGSIESMRNGNSKGGERDGNTSIAFNRIYEEWKLETQRAKEWRLCSSIESMRNGNFSCFSV